MPEPEDQKEVSNTDLRNSQFGGGLINADTVNAGRIGGDIYNIHLGQATSGNSVPILYKHERPPVKVIKTKLVHDEHKFEGKLVLIQVDIYEHSLPREVCIKLSISFGAPEINIPNFNPLLRLNNKTIHIKYGIKNGELNLDFQNGKMPLNRRENLINENNNWEGTAVGSVPSWQFSINNESKSGNQLEILHGNLRNEVLGILELLDLNVASEINAYFKISVNRINIAIIDLDDGTNKKQKETKIGLLLKYLKSELENYVSKVVIRYEPASFS